VPAREACCSVATRVRLRNAPSGDWRPMKRDGVRWLLQDLLGVLVALGILLLLVAAIAIGTAISGG
jgi:hypothetical protein